jgi:hypothetical protein
MPSNIEFFKKIQCSVWDFQHFLARQFLAHLIPKKVRLNPGRWSSSHLLEKGLHGEPYKFCKQSLQRLTKTDC